MIESVMIACMALLLIGMVATIASSDPFNKLISLSVLIAGVFPFIIDRGFLDVAIATALIAPISTIFTLMICRKERI